MSTGLATGLVGCASFNDTLVVDIGDQFELLKLDAAKEHSGHSEAARAHGFECDFNAVSDRDSLFARERQVSGSIRCLLLHDQGTEPDRPTGSD